MTKVLVTGASGFIALHCIDQLLRSGHEVRGTLRTMSRDVEVRTAVGTQDDKRLEFVCADLTSDDGWSDAVAGCDNVLHVASPFPPTAPNHEDDLIVPARDGALRVLKAAKAANVNRVVLTSSLAAIASGQSKPVGHVYTESDWTDVNDPTVGAYEKSKTIAERAVWDFVASEDGPELAVINPGAVLGPLLGKDYSTSGDLVRLLMSRAVPAVPPLGFGCVDVRDVAAAHIAAMTNPNAVGQRFLCCDDHVWMHEIADILAERFNPEGWRIPTRRLPTFIAKLAANFNSQLKRARPMLGRERRSDHTKLRDTLGIQLRSLKEMTLSMAESMIAFGVVKKA